MYRNDRITNSPERFEWAWIEESFLVKLGEWLRSIECKGDVVSLLLRPFVRTSSRAILKEQLQMYRAIIKAHTEAQESEKIGYCSHSAVIEQSMAIVVRAENAMADIEKIHADVVTELSTETAAHLLLLSVREEAKHLRELGQV